MNALDIMQALRDVPEDLIDECFVDTAKRITHKQSAANPTISQSSVSYNVSTNRHKKTVRPYAFSKIVAAACLLFAAGFGGVILHESRKNQPVLMPNTQNTEMQEEQLYPLPKPDYVPLELHEPPRLGTHEQAEEVRKAAQQRFIENGSKRSIIDKRAYIDKYFSADSEADYNDIEAKSYLYHMMLNSIDYYRTAEGTMNCAIPDGVTEVVFQVDLVNHTAYERQSLPEQPTIEMFIADNMQYIATPQDKTYRSQRKPMRMQDLIVSDNDRAWVDENGETFGINRPVSLFPGICSSSLFPQTYAMAMLRDFDKWQVTGTEIRLDRNCAVLEGSFQEVSCRLSIDVETGILLNNEMSGEDGKHYSNFELTSLTVDAEIDVNRFDPEGYTCMDSDEVYLDPEHTVKAPHIYVDYEINESGQTYGSTPDSVYLEDYPDLIAVIGDNGRQGYIYKEDFIGNPPDSPEEAEKIAEAQHNGTYVPKTVNVYDSDGKTVIDTFTENLR